MARKAKKKATAANRKSAKSEIARELAAPKPPAEANEAIGPLLPLEEVRGLFEKIAERDRALDGLCIGPETVKLVKQEQTGLAYDLVAAVRRFIDFCEKDGYPSTCPDLPIPSSLFTAANVPRLAEMLCKRLKTSGNVEFLIVELKGYLQSHG